MSKKRPSLSGHKHKSHRSKGSGPSARRPELDEFDQEMALTLETQLPGVLRLRHEIHKHPELSNQEKETAARIVDALRKHGLRVRQRIAKHGVLGILDGAESGPTIAIRADMDALPIREKSALAWKSRTKSTWEGRSVPVAHACGHDVHVAVALGTAAVLAKHRDKLHGRVLFVFQPAEEGAPKGETGGAKRMLDEKVFGTDRPQAIFGLHAWPELEVGEVGYSRGPVTAAVDAFFVNMHGKQAHGAHPEQGRNPISMAAHAVSAIEALPAQSLSARQSVVVSIGAIQGGERWNIIPEKVTFRGTVRSYSKSAQDQVEQRMREILRGAAQMYGGSFELEYERRIPDLHNHRALASWSGKELAMLLGKTKVHQLPPSMGGEDFAFFAKAYPAFYFRLGVTPSSVSTPAPLHSAEFFADDAAVSVGIKAMATLAMRFSKDTPNL